MGATNAVDPRYTRRDVQVGSDGAGGSGRASYDDEGWAPEEDRALLGYQRRWYYDRSEIKICAKSRQVGITWTTALEAVEVAGARVSDGGMDVYFMTTSLDDARKFIEECVTWIQWLTPIVDGVIDELEVQESEDWFEDDDGDRLFAYRIDFPSGHTIYALPSRPARLRGKQGYAICDEAAYQDLEAWMTAAGGLLMWGGRLAIISTYNGVENEFYRAVEDARARQRDVSPPSLHEINIYDALADGLYRRICRSRPPYRTWTQELEDAWVERLRGHYGEHRFAQECECIPERSGGEVIPKAAIQRCMVLSRDESTIVEIKGGARPTMWIDQVEVEHDSAPWSGDDAADPKSRAETLKQWLDRHLVPVLDRITAERLPVHVGIDYGRTVNITSIPIGVLTRDLRRLVRLVIEMEKVPWPEQDFVQDYLWPRLPWLAAGCADGQGIGSNSAERCSTRTGGKIRVIKINAGWHDPQFTNFTKRLMDESMRLPNHFAPLLRDLSSLRRVRGKIVAPQRVSPDGRRQKRHADTAYSLALFEQSITVDGPGMVKDDQQSRRPRRRRFDRSTTYR